VIKSFIVGRDYAYSSVFVQTDHLGLNLVERLETFDVSDDNDPDLNAKIQELHRRRNELNPEIAGMPADVPAYTGSGVDD
jgi:hypothetical protein